MRIFDKSALFSCRSANLPETHIENISRHSMENIENISWHSMGNIKAIIGTYRKERKREEREKKRRDKWNPIENINGI